MPKTSVKSHTRKVGRRNVRVRKHTRRVKGSSSTTRGMDQFVKTVEYKGEQFTIYVQPSGHYYSSIIYGKTYSFMQDAIEDSKKKINRIQRLPSSESLIRQRTGTIHLQGIGRVRAKPARDFRVGEKFMWNYGGTSRIIGIERETPTQIIFKTQTNDGRTWTRRLNKDRLVAIG